MSADQTESMISQAEPTVEPVPAAAMSLFGERLALAERFADLLAGAGIERGLVGPHERARIWSRHVLNCAVLGELVPPGSRVVDIGSGAGLPGLALALARPDVSVDLVEPLLRRTVFLQEAVELLGLADQVQVLRGRAEEPAIVSAAGSATIVTARAVAPLDRLVGWCLPLLAPEGVLLALKGSNATSEVAEHRSRLGRLGVAAVEVVECGSGVLDPPVAVVRVRRAAAGARTRNPRTATKGRR